MVLEEMNAIYNPWNVLQQPAHTSLGMNASFRALLAAIDQGWQVKEPVQVMPSARNFYWVYYFVLTHSTNTETVSLFVPALPEVQSYVDGYNYSVIEGSSY